MKRSIVEWAVTGGDVGMVTAASDAKGGEDARGSYPRASSTDR